MELHWFDFLYLLNLFCVWFSWRVATQCFEREDIKLGYLNLFASALNAAIIFDHFFF